MITERSIRVGWSLSLNRSSNCASSVLAKWTIWSIALWNTTEQGGPDVAVNNKWQIERAQALCLVKDRLADEGVSEAILGAAGGGRRGRVTGPLRTVFTDQKMYKGPACIDTTPDW